MKMLQTKKATKKQIETIINKELSKSKRIQELFLIGCDVKEISELMSIRYQFAYNVVSNFVNINSLEIVEEEKDSKKSKIIELFLNNNSNIEIAKILKTNYNYVYKILKEYKLQNEKDSKERKESNQ
jgi:superfamily II helicase